MGVGGVADLHGIVGQQHLVGYAFCQPRVEGHEGRAGILVVRSQHQHFQRSLNLDDPLEGAPDN